MKIGERELAVKGLIVLRTAGIKLKALCHGKISMREQGIKEVDHISCHKGAFFSKISLKIALHLTWSGSMVALACLEALVWSYRTSQN